MNIFPESKINICLNRFTCLVIVVWGINTHYTHWAEKEKNHPVYLPFFITIYTFDKNRLEMN